MGKYYTKMLVPFFVGFLISIIFVALFNEAILGQSAVFIKGGLYSKELLMRVGNVVINRPGLFFFALKQRLILYFLLLFLSLSKYKEVRSGVLAYFGVCVGISLTAMIARIGGWGILLFIISIFPQGFFYVLAYGMLVVKMGMDADVKKTGMLTIFIGILLVVTGCFLESYVNSFLVSKFMKIYFT